MTALEGNNASGTCQVSMLNKHHRLGMQIIQEIVCVALAIDSFLETLKFDSFAVSKMRIHCQAYLWSGNPSILQLYTLYNGNGQKNAIALNRVLC
jgi:hypothetical protein